MAPAVSIASRREAFGKIVRTVSALAQDEGCRVLLPAHPTARKQIELACKGLKIEVVGPLPYPLQRLLRRQSPLWRGSCPEAGATAKSLAQAGHLSTAVVIADLR